jgi:hypothetical protein
MNRLIDGSRYRSTPTGILWKKGNRELYLVAKSVTGSDNAKKAMEKYSFNYLHYRAKRVGAMPKNAKALFFDK